MFRTRLCPSSGAHDYNVDYHIGRLVLGLLWVGSWLRVGWSGVRAAGSYSLVITNMHGPTHINLKMF